MLREERMKNKITWYSGAITLIGVGFLLLLFFTIFGNFIHGKTFDPDLLSKYGGFIGGFIGSLFSLAGAFLLFENLKQQSQQQFENIFFQYLNFHNENVKSLTIIDGYYSYQNSPFRCNYNKKHKDRQYFSCLKDWQGELFWVMTFEEPKRNCLDLALISYEKIFIRHQNELGYYYRNLYNIFKLIDRHWKNNGQKKNYFDIVRAQLSKDELFLLYYNLRTEWGESFKELIGNYNLLKHLPDAEKLENIDMSDWKKPEDRVIF